jgi:hypothetical protein
MTGIACPRSHQQDTWLASLGVQRNPPGTIAIRPVARRIIGDAEVCAVSVLQSK